MKLIKEQILQKEQELENLKKQLLDQENNKFNHLIGRCFKLAATCLVYVKEINYIENDVVYVDGIVLTGGEYINNSIEIYFNETEALILDYMPVEITKEEFLKRMDECFELTKNKVKGELF